MVPPTRSRRPSLWELGADVVTIGNEPNGININLELRFDPARSRCRRRSHEVRADIGIALDGDADRVIIVDENGTIVDGDQLMAVIAETWAERRQLRGNGIVATVMSNLGLERFLEGRAWTLHRTKVGDRYVVEHMRQHDFNVGGEQSGHIVLSDFGTTGDGLVAALQILACVKRTGQDGQRSLPPLRAGAAAPEECPHFRRQAAGRPARAAGDRRCGSRACQERPPASSAPPAPSR